MHAFATKANIHLHIIDTQKDGHLTAQHICDSVSEWQQSDIWFCGPSRFAHTLQTAFKKLGLKSNHFHNELFEMR
jgi:predicted ferric reductase